MNGRITIEHTQGVSPAEAAKAVYIALLNGVAEGEVININTGTEEGVELTRKDVKRHPSFYIRRRRD